MDPVQLAARLIRFDTCNPPGRATWGEEEVLLHLAGLLAPAGFSVALDRFGPGRASLVARLNPGRPEPALCLAGHIDTVPLGEAPWSVPPLAGEVRHGRLHGRGASDMKSGIAALCCAALELAAAGVTREIALYVFGGEESGCAGSFSVAGQPELLGRPGAVVVAEPTRNRPLLGHKGALWLAGECAGRTAHGSMPELGDNALYKAVDAVQRLRSLDLGAAPHPHLGAPTLSINTLHAGQNPNSVPDLARFTLDLRTVPAQDHAALAARAAATAGPDAAIATMLDIPAVWTEPDDPWARRAFGVLDPLLDRPAGIETVQFFTDAAAFRRALPRVPILILGPGDPALAHRTDEFCEVDQIRAAAAMYLALGLDWDRGAAARG
jgi:succinyl-diaminopimelate desuccinylase